MPRNILGKEELWNIKREVTRRYRTVEQTIQRGGEAPKAYGNWARPTMESLLETCFGLYDRLDNLDARLARAPVLTTNVWRCEACSAGSGDIGEYREVCGNCFSKLAPVATAETAQWTERERVALDELMQITGLSEHGVMQQGLRVYQLLVKDTHKLVGKDEPPPQPAGTPQRWGAEIAARAEFGELEGYVPPTGTPEPLREAQPGTFREWWFNVGYKHMPKGDQPPEHAAIAELAWNAALAAVPQASPPIKPVFTAQEVFEVFNADEEEFSDPKGYWQGRADALNGLQPDPYAAFVVLAERWRTTENETVECNDRWNCATELDTLIAAQRKGQP